MDYSQFLIMRGEISLLLVFLLIFLFDTFGGKKSLKGLSITACVLFALHTVWNIIPVDSATAFGGMYQTSPIASMVKTVLNIGTLIVLLQSVFVVRYPRCQIAPRRVLRIVIGYLVRYVFNGFVGTLLAVLYRTRNRIVTDGRFDSYQ